MLQLRAVNKHVAAISPHLELVKGDGYFYFVYDDGVASHYGDRSVWVFALNHLSLEQWLQEAYTSLEQLQPA